MTCFKTALEEELPAPVVHIIQPFRCTPQELNVEMQIQELLHDYPQVEAIEIFREGKDAPNSKYGEVPNFNLILVNFDFTGVYSGYSNVLGCVSEAITNKQLTKGFMPKKIAVVTHPKYAHLNVFCNTSRMRFFDETLDGLVDFLGYKTKYPTT